MGKGKEGDTGLHSCRMAGTGASGVMRRPYGDGCEESRYHPPVAVRHGGMKGLDTPFMLKHRFV